MTDFFGLLIVVMLLGAGGYAVFSGIKLRRECVLFANKFLYPGNCPPEACTDVPGFIAFICPRILLFGALCLLLGIASAALNYGIPALGYVLPSWVDWLMIPLMLLPFAWFCMLQAKAAKLFW